MADNVVNRTALETALPAPWPDDPFPSISRTVAASPAKIVILDDDPTGTQTVHGIPVLTTWSYPVLENELRTAGPGFFILTNSRSLPAAAARQLNREIGTHLRRAASATRIPVSLISRSDSTLRGHFPDEVDALMEAMGTPHLPRILIPCFFEGGRITVHDIHYVAEGSRLIPAAQTPYARDAVFGYRHSNLRDWVVEKTGTAISRDRIASVSIDDIRLGGPDRVADRLGCLSAGDCCIVNAVDYRDMSVFVAGLLSAETRRGARFVFRSGASFVRVRTGILPRDLLNRTELTIDNGCGGLFMVGSHVPQSSAQLAVLRGQVGVVDIEIDVGDLLDDGRRPAAIAAASAAADRALEQGRDTVVYTSRKLITGTDPNSNLNIGRRVSDSLISIIKGIECQPRYLVAKGGITSSDVATRGLGVRRAVIMGQALPGVPVWRLGQETRWPGMAYIVFPGNVGDDGALAEIRRRLALPD